MSTEYVLMTDNNCDFPYDYYKEHNIPYASLTFTVDGETYLGNDVSYKEFYDFLRAKKTPLSAAANTENIKAVMESIVKSGKDVIYLAFSSGLSATYDNGVRAADELREIYPERKIIAVDTLCASMGQGLLVYLAMRQKNAGMGIDELNNWVKANRLHISHYVMADDLMFLHRGGRVSKSSAVAGSMLGIKPIIYMDNEGKLQSIDKIRGKKQALTALVDKIEKAAEGKKSDFFMVSHADCEEDAKFVAELMSKRFGIKDYMINYIGPVTGAHTGIGTVAAFMMTEHR